MKALGVTLFKKTAACPSESDLVCYRTNKLAREVMALVKAHLGSCDFCGSELTLLSHYSMPAKGEGKAPDIPMDLRILAESLLFRNGKKAGKGDGSSA